MDNWIQRFSLNRRTALVTGASKGIGQEICSVFADAGASIVATGRDTVGLAVTKNLVEQAGGTCSTFECDLRSKESILKLVSTMSDQKITIDILVNNAGIAKTSLALDTELDDWDESMAVNVRAPFQLAQLLAPHMMQQRWGKIVNISSQAAVIAFDQHTAYSASKAAMNAMTRGLMKEWASFNIQVNAICPTVVLTDMGRKVWGAEEKSSPMIERTPSGRFGEPVEVADMALYLASSASSLVNGETLLIDGGFSAV